MVSSEAVIAIKGEARVDAARQDYQTANEVAVLVKCHSCDLLMIVSEWRYPRQFFGLFYGTTRSIVP